MVEQRQGQKTRTAFQCFKAELIDSLHGPIVSIQAGEVKQKHSIQMSTNH